jgi:hypothetical protein
MRRRCVTSLRVSLANNLLRSTTLTQHRSVSHSDVPAVPPSVSVTALHHGSAGPPRPPAPLILLDQVFRSDGSARSLHKELLVAIASGNCEESSEIAAALASIVKRRLAEAETGASSSMQHHGQEASPAEKPSNQSDLPPVTDAAIGHALDKVADAAASRGLPDPPFHSGKKETSDVEPSTPWLSSKHLTVTILETSFEVSDDDATAEEHERILDQYLSQEGERWKLQKHAIANAVLSAARHCGITPLALQSGDEGSVSFSTPQTANTINVLKHCNIVVRGEVPEVLSSTSGSSDSVINGCREELAALEQRYIERGLPPMSARDKQIALLELVMSRTTVRYSVGLKKDLSSGLDRSAAVGKGGVPSSTGIGAEAYHQHMITALNAESSATEGHDMCTSRHLLSQPVLPYSFMMKLCLWYDAEAMMNSGGAELP